MTTIANSILEFVLGLFDDPEKARAFTEDPEGALAEAGLPGVAPAEVHDLMPMVAGYAPGGWHGKPHHDDDHHAPVAKPDHRDDDDHHHAPIAKPDDCDDDHRPDHHDHGHHGHHGPVVGSETTVIAHVQNIQNDITYVNVEIDASHGIWVSGDAQAIFGGDGDDEITVVDNEGGFYVGDDLDTDGGDIEIGNTDIDVDIVDSNIAVGGDVHEDSNNTTTTNSNNTTDSNNTTETTTVVDLENADINVNLGGNQNVVTGNEGTTLVENGEGDLDAEDSAISTGGDANSGYQADNSVSVGDVTYAPDHSQDNDVTVSEDNDVTVSEDNDVTVTEDNDVTVEVDDVVLNTGDNSVVGGDDAEVEVDNSLDVEFEEEVYVLEVEAPAV